MRGIYPEFRYICFGNNRWVSYLLLMGKGKTEQVVNYGNT